MKMRFFIVLAAAIVGCSSDKMISQNELEDIIREALISQAIEQTDMAVRGGKDKDSVDFYTPILARKGYTMADFRYTIASMASRKSNPLNATLDRVVLQVEAMTLSADDKYRIFLRADSVVVAMFSDTIYYKADTLLGKFKKNNLLQFKGARAGSYKIELDYKSVDNYRVAGKSITYRGGDSTKNGRKLFVDGSFWLQRKTEPSKFSSSFTISSKVDTLNIRFVEPKAIKGLTYVDSSYVTNVRFIYSPFVDDARRKFLEKLYDNKYLFNGTTQDSISFRFGGER